MGLSSADLNTQSSGTGGDPGASNYCIISPLTSDRASLDWGNAQSCNTGAAANIKVQCQARLKEASYSLWILRRLDTPGAEIPGRLLNQTHKPRASDRDEACSLAWNDNTSPSPQQFNYTASKTGVQFTGPPDAQCSQRQSGGPQLSFLQAAWCPALSGTQRTRLQAPDAPRSPAPSAAPPQLP